MQCAAMKKLNLSDIPPEDYRSPRGRYHMRCQEISRAMGARDEAGGGLRRHPFEIELVALLPGKRNCPYHLHSAEHEFYIVMSGRGQVRHEGGLDEIGAGDCLVFPPGEPHQLICADDAIDPLVYWVIADNVNGTDVCFYPDSDKWAGLPGRGPFRIDETAYHDGEE